MTNHELQKMLKKFPDDMEIGVFVEGTTVIRPITCAYIGNEKHFPGNNNSKTKDKIILNCSR